MKRQVSHKIAPKSDNCLFVGYPKGTKGYYFYNRTDNKVFVARTAFFLEREYLSKRKSGSKIVLDEIQDPQQNDEPESVQNPENHSIPQ